jgi:predicted ATP-grasp superfamily ATP-dependent carboligase
MSERPRQVVIAGISTRALAASAARAGYAVTAVDAFGDLDLRRTADVVAKRSGERTQFTPMSAATAADEAPGGLACYTSNFENYPAAVERLACGRTLLGNPASVLTRVRDPLLLMHTLGQLGFEIPQTQSSAPPERNAPDSWLLKPRRSGGGHGTRVWRRSRPFPGTHYLQQRLPGTPGSILLAANGHQAVVLGVSRQLVGDARLGAGGFRYCGSLLGSPAILFPGQSKLTEIAEGLASALAREFMVRGLNGIDFIATAGVPCPIEVNPRYSASMELLERAEALSLFQIHEQACSGVLPTVRIASEGIHGKAIVFARKTVVMGDTREWLDDSSLADIPHPREKIRRGHPICTVFATGSDADSCYERLVSRAAAVYRMTEAGGRSAA